MDHDVRVVLGLPGGLKQFEFHGDEGTAAAAAANADVGPGAGKIESAGHGHAGSPTCAATQAKEDGAGHVFCARYDYLYCQESSLQPVSRQAAADDERMRRLLRAEETLPNSQHPSDHLPIKAAFRYR